MATFTIPLKRVISLTGGTIELVDGVSKLTGGNIGLQHYTIFDETYRDHLDGRIIDHYWNREIGLESVEMFQLAMRRKMNEIMPYYNQLYLSTRVEYDPLSTINLHTVMSNEANQETLNAGTGEAASNSTSESRAVNSETPQTMLSGDADYATAATDSNGEATTLSTTTENSSSNTSSEGNGDTLITGFQGTASSLIMAYRDSLINVDLMIIGELEELFMLVWDNGDNYTKGFLL